MTRTRFDIISTDVTLIVRCFVRVICSCSMPTGPILILQYHSTLSKVTRGHRRPRGSMVDIRFPIKVQ